MRRREGIKMNEDDISRDSAPSGRRGRRSPKGRSTSTIARPKAPQRPRVSSRNGRKPAAEEPQPSKPAAEASVPAAVETQKADEMVTAPGSDDAEARGGGEEERPGASEASPPAKRTAKRRSPRSKAGDATPEASPEAQDTQQGRGRAGALRGGARQRADRPGKRIVAGGRAAPSAGRAQPTTPERVDVPTVDPMKDLAGLAERSLQESLQSLRSVSESRTLSELLERQSRHMRLMTEIWMRQAQRSMEVSMPC
jgi:hypothetical protein